MKKRIVYTSVFIGTLCLFQGQLVTASDSGLLIEAEQEPYGYIVVSDGQKGQKIHKNLPFTVDNYESVSITVHQNWKDFGWRKRKRANYVELKISNKSPNLNYMIFILTKNRKYPILKPSEGALKPEESKNIIIKPKYGNTTFLVEPTTKSLRRALNINIPNEVLVPQKDTNKEVVANEEEIDTVIKETIIYSDEDMELITPEEDMPHPTKEEISRKKGTDALYPSSEKENYFKSKNTPAQKTQDFFFKDYHIKKTTPRRPSSLKFHGYNIPGSLDTPQPEGPVREVYKRKGSVLRDHGYNVPTYMDEPEDYESIDE